MAFKHELGITKPQYFCIEFVANTAEGNWLSQRIVDHWFDSLGAKNRYRDDLYREYVNNAKKAAEFRFKLVFNYGLGLQECLAMEGLASEKLDRFATPTDSRDRWINEELRKFGWYLNLGEHLDIGYFLGENMIY